MIAQALKNIINEGRDVKIFNDHLHAARQTISSAKQAISIDNIVDALEDQKIELIAKLGIVRAIQRAEQKSRKFQKSEDGHDSLKLENFRATWYDSLTKILCEKRRKTDIDNIFDNISFVSFNYDRCIEHYLPYSISNYYGVQLDRVRTLMPKLQIHRPYGIAGYLPWMGKSGDPSHFEHSSANALAEAAGLIRTFTEGVEKPDTLENMRNELSMAERVIFLGFAFHPQNMSILKCKLPQNAEFLATAQGLSVSDKRVVAENIGDTFGLRPDRTRRISIAGLSCNDLFNSFWRTITAPARRVQDIGIEIT